MCTPECNQHVSGAVWFSQKIVCVCVCRCGSESMWVGVFCVWRRRSLFLAVSIFSGSLPPAGCGGQCDNGAAATGSPPWSDMVDTLHIIFCVCCVCVCVFTVYLSVFLVSNFAFKPRTVHWNTLLFMSEIIYKCLCVIRQKYLCLCFVLPYSFQDMVSYLGLKPKPGEKEVVPSYVFMLWYEFCNDFKNAWIRQSKNISKERWGCFISNVSGS